MKEGRRERDKNTEQPRDTEKVETRYTGTVKKKRGTIRAKCKVVYYP